MPLWHSSVSGTTQIEMGPAGRLLGPLPTSRRPRNTDGGGGGGGAEVQAGINELSTDSPDETEDDDESQDDNI
jgi:hypothetical protein